MPNQSFGFERWCHKLTCAKCSKVFSSLGYNICIKLQVEVATKNLLGLEQKDSVLEFKNMEVPFNDLNTVKKFPERCKKARENKTISKESYWGSKGNPGDLITARTIFNEDDKNVKEKQGTEWPQDKGLLTSITILPAGSPPMLISKKTLGFGAFFPISASFFPSEKTRQAILSSKK